MRGKTGVVSAAENRKEQIKGKINSSAHEHCNYGIELELFKAEKR